MFLSYILYEQLITLKYMAYVKDKGIDSTTTIIKRYDKRYSNCTSKYSHKYVTWPLYKLYPLRISQQYLVANSQRGITWTNAHPAHGLIYAPLSACFTSIV